MTTIFIVTRASGEYADYSISNQAAFFNRVDAEKYIDGEKEKIALTETIETELGNLYETYDAENPQPEYLKPHDIPKWGAGLSKNQITQEMRDTRDHLERLNKELIDNQNKLRDDWQNSVLNAQREYVKTKGYDFEVEYVIYYARHNDFTWDIEELEIK